MHILAVSLRERKRQWKWRKRPPPRWHESELHVSNACAFPPTNEHQTISTQAVSKLMNDLLHLEHMSNKNYQNHLHRSYFLLQRFNRRKRSNAGRIKINLGLKKKTHDLSQSTKRNNTMRYLKTKCTFAFTEAFRACTNAAYSTASYGK